MQIQVLGTGCATCKSLFEITKKAVHDMGLQTTVDYVTDISKMIEMGIMTSPVLLVNDQVVMTGFSKDIEKIKELITMGINNPTPQNAETKDDGSCCEKDSVEDRSSQSADKNAKGCNCGSGCC